MTEDEIRHDILSKLSVPVWPHTGKALGLSRNYTYAAVRRNEIPAIRIGKRLTVPTEYLRTALRLESRSPAPP